MSDSPKNQSPLKICRFLDNADFAYSVAYDEGHLEVLANAYPLHEEYGIPGHVPVIVGQLGKRRNCYLSTSNGYFHMGVEHLKFLIGRGWSVGNHSYSHFVYPEQPGLDLEREIVYSKYLLEQEIEAPVTLYTVANLHDYHAVSLPYVIKAKYLGCKYPVTGDLNGDDVDLMKIHGVRLATDPETQGFAGPKEFHTESFDPNAVKGSWLYETTHLVQHVPDHPRKNISCADLKARLSTIRKAGGSRFWPAVPEDVIDYILLKRATHIEALDKNRYQLDIDYPPGIRAKKLSFKIEDRDKKISRILYDQRELNFRRENNEVIFTIDEIRAVRGIEKPVIELM